MNENLGLGVPLYDPPDGGAKVDIVFVHGLGGNRIGTWSSKPTTEIPMATFWPKDLLPTACPTARILSFGYDSKFIGFYPFFGKKSLSEETTIDDYSSSLYHDLANLRSSTKTPNERPIIFVAHSLGGLVVANAVSRLHGVNENAKSLSDNTIGMVFLGTPFQGSTKAEWSKLGERLAWLIPSIKTDDIKDLLERSAKLVSINDDLSKYIKERDRDHKKRPLDIVCYFEEYPTYVGKKNIGKIVTKPSAASIPAITILSIAANHETICKFPGDFVHGYISVSGQLRQWIEKIDAKEHGKEGNEAVALKFAGTVTNNGVIAGTITSTHEKGNEVIGSKTITNNFGYGSPEEMKRFME